MKQRPLVFKWRQFEPEIILCAVRWYLRFSLSCRDHEGGGSVKFQQWDGAQWNAITDWIATDQALVRPLVEASAAKYAQEKGITPRACP